MDLEYTYSPSCPFCPFTDEDDTFVAKHIQYCHPEDSFEQSETSYTDLAAEERQSTTRDLGLQVPDHDELYMECPHGCGEVIKTFELCTHLDLHAAQEIAYGTTSSVLSRPSDCDGKIERPSYPQPKSHVDHGDHGETRDVSIKGWPREQRRGRRQNPSSPATNASAIPPGRVKRLGV